MSDFSSKAMIDVTISTSYDNNRIERKFSPKVTVKELKNKMELFTGGNSATMTVKAHSANEAYLFTLDNDFATLDSYPIEKGMILLVEDAFTLKRELDNPGEVPRFKLADEDYAKRQDSLLSHLKKNKLGKFSEERGEEKKKEEILEKAQTDNISIGDRCQVSGSSCKRGTVMYKGRMVALTCI